MYVATGFFHFIPSIIGALDATSTVSLTPAVEQAAITATTQPAPPPKPLPPPPIETVGPKRRTSTTSSTAPAPPKPDLFSSDTMKFIALGAAGVALLVLLRGGRKRR
jgi:hypothetical protein